MRVCAMWIGVLLASQAAAAEFRFDQSSSELRFDGDYLGEAVPGRFERFSGVASFDPSQPLTIRFRTEIEVDSLNTDYADRDDSLRAPEFFDVATHPRALWESDGACRAQGAGWECPGRLSLKGQTHPVPITVTALADGSGVEGRATLDRLRFGVGTDDWADPETIGPAVEVRFLLRWIKP